MKKGMGEDEVVIRDEEVKVEDERVKGRKVRS